MKKKFLLRKIIFHISNIGIILIYLYPGSIFGWLFYGNMQKQPQLTSDFVIFSSNHTYTFIVLSLLGLFSYYKNKVKILFLYLFFISIFLELCHLLIPQRSFEYQDFFGNFLRILIFIVFNLYKYFKKMIKTINF